MAIYDRPLRTDSELRSLLHILLANGGACSDAELQRELLDTGYVRPDADLGRDRLHLTPEGVIFVKLR